MRISGVHTGFSSGGGRDRRVGAGKRVSFFKD